MDAVEEVGNRDRPPRVEPSCIMGEEVVDGSSFDVAMYTEEVSIDPPPSTNSMDEYGNEAMGQEQLFAPLLDDEMVMEVEIDGRQSTAGSPNPLEVPELGAVSPSPSVNSSCDGGGTNSVYSSPCDSPSDLTRSRNRRFHSDLCDVTTGLPVSEDIRHGYRMLKELMAPSFRHVNTMFMTELGPTDDASIFYKPDAEVITLYSIKETFENSNYNSLTDFVRDFRNMLENYIRYFGPEHASIKKCEKFGTMLDQKIALMSRKFHGMATIAQTHSEYMKSEDPEPHWAALAAKNKALTFTSALISYLRQESKEKEREQRKQHLAQKEKERETYNHEIACWEASLFTDNDREQMLSSWELPQVGLFLYLCQEPLNCGSICQYAVERMALLCKESEAMGLVMTSLLSTPYQRQYLDRRPLMPYDVWCTKLSRRMDDWYKTLQDNGRDFEVAADKIGIEATFWHVVGRLKNPLTTIPFHQLTYYQRIWIVKSLCDSCMFTQSSLREVVDGQSAEETRSYLLGMDGSGATYIHFPQFCGDHLRVYKINPQKKAGRGRRPANVPTEVTETNTDSNLSDTMLRPDSPPVDVCTVQSSQNTSSCSTPSITTKSRGRRSKEHTPPSHQEDDSALRLSARALRLAKRSERFYYEAMSRFKMRNADSGAAVATTPTSLSVDGTEPVIKNYGRGTRRKSKVGIGDKRDSKLRKVGDTAESDNSNSMDTVSNVKREAVPVSLSLPENVDRQIYLQNKINLETTDVEFELPCNNADNPHIHSITDTHNPLNDINVDSDCGYKTEGDNEKEGPQPQLTENSKTTIKCAKISEPDESVETLNVNCSNDLKNEDELVKSEECVPTAVEEPEGGEEFATSNHGVASTNTPRSDELTKGEEAGESTKAEGDESIEPAKEPDEPEVDLITSSPDTQTYRLICQSVEELRNLCQRFSGSRGREVDLHEALCDLLAELAPWESKLLTLDKKAKDKLKKDQEDYVEPLSEEADEGNGEWDTDEGEDGSSTEEASEGEQMTFTADKADTEYIPPSKEKKPKREKAKIKEEKEKEEEDKLQEFGVSVFGRKRKRRVIPNNTEADPFTIAKKKPKKDGKEAGSGNTPLPTVVTKMDTLPTSSRGIGGSASPPSSANLQTLKVPDGFVLVRINKQMYLVPKNKLPSLLSQPHNSNIQVINKGVKVVNPPNITTLTTSIKTVPRNTQSKTSLSSRLDTKSSLLANPVLMNPAILHNSLLSQTTAKVTPMAGFTTAKLGATRLYTSPLIDPSGSISSTSSVLTESGATVNSQHYPDSKPAISISSITTSAALPSSDKPNIVGVISRKSFQNKQAYCHFNPSLTRMPHRSPSTVLHQAVNAGAGDARPPSQIRKLHTMIHRTPTTYHLVPSAQQKGIVTISERGITTSATSVPPPANLHLHVSQATPMEVTVDNRALQVVPADSSLAANSAAQGRGTGNQPAAPLTAALSVSNPSLFNQITHRQDSAQIKLHISPSTPNQNKLNSFKHAGGPVKMADNKSIQIILPTQQSSNGGQTPICTNVITSSPAQLQQKSISYFNPTTGSVIQRISINSTHRPPRFVARGAAGAQQAVVPVMQSVRYRSPTAASQLSSGAKGQPLLSNNMTFKVSTSQGVQYIPAAGSQATKIIQGAILRHTTPSIRHSVPQSLNNHIRQTIPQAISQTRATGPVIQRAQVTAETTTPRTMVSTNVANSLSGGAVIQGVCYTTPSGLAVNAPSNSNRVMAVRTSGASGTSVTNTRSIILGEGDQLHPATSINHVQGNKHLIVLRNANGKFYLPQVVNSNSLPAPVRVTTVRSGSKPSVGGHNSNGQLLSGASNSNSEILSGASNSNSEILPGANDSTTEILISASNPTQEQGHGEALLANDVVIRQDNSNLISVSTPGPSQSTDTNS